MPRRFSSSYYTASVSHLPLSVGGATVFPDDTVLNLGVTFDTQLTMRNDVDMQLLLPASSVTFCSMITDRRSTAHPLPRVHCKPHWLLQRSSLRCHRRCHPTTPVSSACYGVADRWHPTLWTHHTDTVWYSSLAADITAHHLQNCADDVRLFSRMMSKVLWWCVHSCTHRCCTFAITISRPQWPRHPTRVVDSFWLPQL